MDLIIILFAFLLGAGLAAIISKYFFLKTAISLKQFTAVDQEKILLQERLDILKKSFQELDELYKKQGISLEETRKNISEKQSQNAVLHQKIKFQEEKFNELNLSFSQKFERIAAEILQKNSSDFAKINHEKLNLILTPLKEKITIFEKKVEETHHKQSIETNLLKQEIINLAELNQQITTEANNLTKALKGDNKIQGNWGEMVLEKVLERSGLSKGEEYFTQGTNQQLKNFEGNTQKPDVVILLPDNKHVIIDAKVSLKAYEKSTIATEEDDYQKYIKLHIQSVKNHVKGLSEKYYQQIEHLNSPDFVLLFLPIESSFSSVVSGHGDELFNYAWDKKVVIVSPTTLLATLKTVASIWKNEKQNKNAIKIAEESGRLYDKFYAFISDLEKIGKHIQGSQEAYDEAFKKLKTGRGNLMDKAQKLKGLGINAKKSLPEVNDPEKSGHIN